MANQPSTSKVAIPRLEKRDQDSKFPQEKHGQPRVQKACDNCRKRKVRCSGEQPRCQNCVDQLAHCTYPQARKDRLKDATGQISRLVALLKDLNVHVDHGGQQKIDDLLASLGSDASPTKPVTKPLAELSGRTSVPIAESRDGPDIRAADVSGSVGSNDDLDIVDEDLFRSRESRATGFVGQNSEVQWFRSLKTKVDNSGSSTEPPTWQPHGPPGSRNEATARHTNTSHTRKKLPKSGSILHVSDSTFYLDTDDLDVDIVVDPYELPPPRRAAKLFDCYMQTVHTSFPILPVGFEDQFRKYIESLERNRPYQVPKSWQGMLNLVLAIGAQYSHLIQVEWRGDGRDHLVYMTRAARILGLDKMATTFPAPTLSSIQATGLLSLYYLTIGQVSRAWMMIGISLRFALAVGLHLRNDDLSATPSKKEDLIRTWWSLLSIESLLCTLIGRPCVISNDQCTVPLPLGTLEGQSGDRSPIELKNPMYWKGKSTTFPRRSSLGPQSGHDSDATTRTSFLGARVTMDLIMQKALSKLYSPRTTVDSWKQIQKDIGSLSRELDEWMAGALPAELNLTNLAQPSSAPRERLLLSFQYYSAKLLVCRPCLCRLEQQVQDQSDASADFNQKTAEACIQAAQAITMLFPDEPNLTFIYQQSPWWCIVHNIMQAIAVFLLEMSFGEIHMTHPGDGNLESVKKLVRWLRLMSVSNVVAGRAYEVVADIVKTGARRFRADISSILVDQSADISQNQPFHISQPPNSSIFPWHLEDFSLQLEWEMTSSNDAAATTNFDTQYPTTLLEQRSGQDFEAFQPSEYSLFEPNLQITPPFGNPFFTNFDLPNPLDGPISPDRDATMDDA